MNMSVTEPPLEEKRGSLNHSYVQANLTWLLKNLGQYAVLTELSLSSGKDSAGEIRPDVCLYPKLTINRLHDVLKMTDMPLLAIEILSPRQSLYETVEKIRLYFQLGVKSCWLVEPTAGVVMVFASPDSSITFSSGEVVDENLSIRLPLEQIFN